MTCKTEAPGDCSAVTCGHRGVRLLSHETLRSRSAQGEICSPARERMPRDWQGAGQRSPRSLGPPLFFPNSTLRGYAGSAFPSYPQFYNMRRIRSLTGVLFSPMRAYCENCGQSVDADGPGLYARNVAHLHFCGNCATCDSEIQWHQTVIGMVGPTPLLGAARPCPTNCRHRNPAALGPFRR